MKKIIFSVFMSVLLIGGTLVNAQTTTVQTQTDAIASLTAQIKALQDQRQAQVSQLLTTLKQGSRSDAVTTLQTLLALDASLYPEGQVTGYYGPKTAKAVRKFQQKYGLPQVGAVGPKTLEKLKEYIKELGLTVDASATTTTQDEDNNHGEKRHDGLCVIVPPGHLIAPGWLKKNGGKAPTIPTCQTLPKGIEDKINGTNPLPDQSDKTAPTISTVVTSDITSAGAKISFSTNEAAKAKLWISTTSPVATTGSATKEDTTAMTSHAFTLTGLTASTTYYYALMATDAAGNTTATATQGSFMTIAPDTTAPAISAVTVSDITATGAKVTFTTNESAKGKIWNTTAATVVTSGAATLEESTASTTHTLTLTGLTAGTVYNFIVGATDAAANTGYAAQGTFTTLTIDVTAPIISSSTVSAIAQTSATIGWTTNEAAKSTVYYGTVNPLILASASKVESSVFNTTHSFALTGLTANTTYYYVVESTDAATNKTTATQSSFVTLP